MWVSGLQIILCLCDKQKQAAPYERLLSRESASSGARVSANGPASGPRQPQADEAPTQQQVTGWLGGGIVLIHGIPNERNARVAVTRSGCDIDRKSVVWGKSVDLGG